MKITGLTHDQQRELARLADTDASLGLTVTRTTASTDNAAGTLAAVLETIELTRDRGRKNALHSIKRKLIAAGD